MQLDALTLRLRPREPWEAIDLGAALLHENFRPVLLAWLAVYLPAALLAHLALPAPSLWPWLMLWWLKPLFDRVALYVFGQVVFGAKPKVGQVLLAFPNFGRAGLIGSLTWRRLDPARSFNLCVSVLEGLRGRAASARRRVLNKRAWGHATWLTLVCANFEFIALAGLYGLVTMVVPDPAGGGQTSTNILQTLFGKVEEIPVWLHYLTGFAYVASVTAIELLYVACGFTLYLNRRILLEGWDIEMALRSLSSRSAAAAQARRFAPALAAVVLLGVLGVAAPSPAAMPDAKKQIEEVLKAPEFQRYEKRTFWKYVGPEWQRADDKTTSPAVQVGGLGRVAAQIVRFALWIAAGAVVAWLVWYALRWRFAATAALPPQPLDTDERRGAQFAGEPLPANITEAARALLEEGRVRDALGLLYRASVAQFNARDSDTEKDCVARLMKGAEPRATYFTELVRAWQRAAYAGEPSPSVAQALVRAWPTHFEAAA